MNVNENHPNAKLRCHISDVAIRYYLNQVISLSSYFIAVKYF